MTTVDRISPQQLRDRFTDDPAPLLIDTRPESDYDEWHIDGAVHYRFSTDSTLDPESFAAETGAEPERPVIAICAEGKASLTLAEALSDAGYRSVASVQDGMQGWSEVYEIEAVPTRDPEIDIMQFYRPAKGCLGYMVGWGPADEAAVIDPTRHIDQFLDLTTDADHEITHVIDTHVHADHISGGRKLADAVGAEYYLSERAADRSVAYDYRPIRQNEVIEVGPLQLKALATPGHTTEMTSILINDDAVCTGDTLFVDSVGRTELQYGTGRAPEGARSLYHSLHATLLALPDVITVLPGHAGDEFIFDEGAIFSSIGELRTTLPLLQLPEDQFVATLTEDLPPKPPNFETIIEINTGQREPPSSDDALELELGPNRCAVPSE